MSEGDWNYGILISQGLSAIRFFNEHKNRMPTSRLIRLWSDAIWPDYFCKHGRSAVATREQFNPELIKFIYLLCIAFSAECRVHILQNQNFIYIFIIYCGTEIVSVRPVWFCHLDTRNWIHALFSVYEPRTAPLHGACCWGWGRSRAGPVRGWRAWPPPASHFHESVRGILPPAPPAPGMERL